MTTKKEFEEYKTGMDDWVKEITQEMKQLSMAFIAMSEQHSQILNKITAITLRLNHLQEEVSILKAQMPKPEYHERQNILFIKEGDDILKKYKEARENGNVWKRR